MPRQDFQKALDEIQHEVLSMGESVEQALTRSVEILKSQDLEAAQKLIDHDQEINRRRFALEEKCLRLLATQQPIAGDLRTIAAILYITNELERIGDYAKGIAHITLYIGAESLIKPLIDLPVMAEKSAAMLQRSLEAFANRDLEAARTIPDSDDEVDALYNQVQRELITLIMANPRVIDQANYLGWAAHNLERTADRATNVCERVIFMVTGELSEMDSKHG